MNLFSDFLNAISIKFILENHVGEVTGKSELECNKNDIIHKNGKDQEYVSSNSCLKDNFVSYLNDDDILC